MRMIRRKRPIDIFSLRFWGDQVNATAKRVPLALLASLDPQLAVDLAYERRHNLHAKSRAAGRIEFLWQSRAVVADGQDVAALRGLVQADRDRTASVLGSVGDQLVDDQAERKGDGTGQALIIALDDDASVTAFRRQHCSVLPAQFVEERLEGHGFRTIERMQATVDPRHGEVRYADAR